MLGHMIDVYGTEEDGSPRSSPTEFEQRWSREDLERFGAMLGEMGDRVRQIADDGLMLEKGD